VKLARYADHAEAPVEQHVWYDYDPTPVDFPSEKAIYARAFELFFQDRAAPAPFNEYRRRAETELLEHAFQKMMTRSYRRKFRADR